MFENINGLERRRANQLVCNIHNTAFCLISEISNIIRQFAVFIRSRIFTVWIVPNFFFPIEETVAPQNQPFRVLATVTKIESESNLYVAREIVHET